VNAVTFPHVTHEFRPATRQLAAAALCAYPGSPSSSPTSSTSFGSSSPTVTMDPSSSSSSSAQDASALLRDAAFARPDAASAPAGDAVTANDLLLGSFDATRLHPLAGLTDTLDYLTLDDDKINDLEGAQTAVPSRGFGDDLSYGTGTMYISGAYIPRNGRIPVPSAPTPGCPLILVLCALIVYVRQRLTYAHAGLALGGAWGLREGASRPLAVSNARLRLNSVLNSVTRRGTFIGNSAGVLGAAAVPRSVPLIVLLTGGDSALVYNAINSSIDAFRGKHDTLGSMVAGAMTGALYKSSGASSPRSACRGLQNLEHLRLALRSWGQARARGGYHDLWRRRGLVLCQASYLISHTPRVISFSRSTLRSFSTFQLRIRACGPINCRPLTRSARSIRALSRNDGSISDRCAHAARHPPASASVRCG
jgi:import inner membrane translocase subunit TIM23